MCLHLCFLPLLGMQARYLVFGSEAQHDPKFPILHCGAVSCSTNPCPYSFRVFPRSGLGAPLARFPQSPGTALAFSFCVQRLLFHRLTSSSSPSAFPPKRHRRRFLAILLNGDVFLSSIGQPVTIAKALAAPVTRRSDNGFTNYENIRVDPIHSDATLDRR
jgi:hypothetical protein